MNAANLSTITDRLVGTDEAARILGLARNTLEIWRCHRRGPSYTKIGRSVKYKISDLDSFISQGRVEHPAANVNA